MLIPFCREKALLVLSGEMWIPLVELGSENSFPSTMDVPRDFRCKRAPLVGSHNSCPPITERGMKAVDKGEVLTMLWAMGSDTGSWTVVGSGVGSIS